MNTTDAHILVVEDDAELLRAVVETLAAEGFQALGASDVRAATFKLKNQKFACVLVDLRLGEEKGEEVIDFMRSRRDIPNHSTPILVISGHLDPDVLKELATKIQGAVVKPFDREALTEKVRKAIGAHGAD